MTRSCNRSRLGLTPSLAKHHHRMLCSLLVASCFLLVASCSLLATPSALTRQVIRAFVRRCCLCINGGRLLLLAGRSLCMERIVRIRGHEPSPTFVATPSEFEAPAWYATEDRIRTLNIP